MPKMLDQFLNSVANGFRAIGRGISSLWQNFTGAIGKAANWFGGDSNKNELLTKLNFQIDSNNMANYKPGDFRTYLQEEVMYAINTGELVKKKGGKSDSAEEKDGFYTDANRADVKLGDKSIVTRQTDTSFTEIKNAENEFAAAIKEKYKILTPNKLDPEEYIKKIIHSLNQDSNFSTTSTLYDDLSALETRAGKLFFYENGKRVTNYMPVPVEHAGIEADIIKFDKENGTVSYKMERAFQLQSNDQLGEGTGPKIKTIVMTEINFFALDNQDNTDKSVLPKARQVITYESLDPKLSFSVDQSLHNAIKSNFTLLNIEYPSLFSRIVNWFKGANRNEENFATNIKEGLDAVQGNRAESIDTEGASASSRKSSLDKLIKRTYTPSGGFNEPSHSDQDEPENKPALSKKNQNTNL